ncbi:MAG TPA: cytochrome c biogenesis protein CcdA [Clostridiaceae bacterium]|nr:cytochrome c biogenesis protein CcdA [Clostridiaceae bacterium]
MDKISLFMAFSAGLLSFLSPCVLPLVPAYVGYLTGTGLTGDGENRSGLKVIYKALGFIACFSIVFVILGASISALGSFFAGNLSLLRKIGGVFIIIMGLHISGLIKIKALYGEKRALQAVMAGKSAGPVLMGMAFAAGWTPCIGPILSSILIYAGSRGTVGEGVLLLCAYSLGFAVPFLLTSLAIDRFLVYFRKLSKYIPAVSLASGLLLIVMGILVFTNNLTLINRYFN